MERKTKTYKQGELEVTISGSPEMVDAAKIEVGFFEDHPTRARDRKDEIGGEGWKREFAHTGAPGRAGSIRWWGVGDKYEEGFEIFIYE